MMNYKQIELEIQDFVKQGQHTAWEIATRCVKLLNESDSYAQSVGLKPDDVVAHLDGYLKNYAVDLESVITILQVFPIKSQWNKSLLDLLIDAEKIIKKSQKEASESEKAPRKKATLAELKEALERIKELESLLAEANSENQRLSQDNESLREQLATARGQMSELRRASREAAMAN